MAYDDRQNSWNLGDGQLWLGTSTLGLGTLGANDDKQTSWNSSSEQVGSWAHLPRVATATSKNTDSSYWQLGIKYAELEHLGQKKRRAEILESKLGLSTLCLA